MATRSENPFSPAFWIGSVDPRPLALARIAIGLSLLHDLANLAGDLRAFYTDDGMLPRAAIDRVDHVYGYTWGLLDYVGSPLGAWVFFALGTAAVVAFTLGFKTRLATFATWVFLASLHHRNYFMTDGGDDIVRILLFFGIFAELGAAYSVDAVRAPTRVVDVPAFGLRLLQLQVAVLYFCAARLKYRSGWLHGDNIYYALELDGFLRPPGALLMQYPSLCRLATKLVVLMEGVFAFAAFSPVFVTTSRAVAIAAGLGVQLGILATMRVGIFTEVMLAVMFLFVMPAWLDSVEAWVTQRGWMRTDARPMSAIDAPRPLLVVAGLLMVQFIVAVWPMFAGRRFPMPRVVHDEVAFVGLEARYGLFDVTYDAPNWDAQGQTADGRSVEVFEVVAPGAVPSGAAWSFSRWNKFRFKGSEHAYRWPELGAYLCRAYDERRPGDHLVSFTLINHAVPPHAPGAPVPPPKDIVLWHELCP